MNKFAILAVLYFLNYILIQSKFLDKSSLEVDPIDEIMITIDKDDETALREAIDILNEKGGMIILNTPVIYITEHKVLKLTGTKKAGILGIRQPSGEYPSIYLDIHQIDSHMPSPKFFSGIELYGGNKYLKNIIVEHSIGSGIYIKGQNNTLDHVIARYNSYSGIQIDTEGDNNVIKNCYSYRNLCTIYGEGTGFLVSGANNVLFENCAAFDNANYGFSSGLDSNNPKNISYSHCSSWNNGNIDVFTGKYDFDNGKPLDKNIWIIEKIINIDNNFEKNYKNGQFQIPNIHIYNRVLSDFFSDIENKAKKIGFELARENNEAINHDVKRNIDYCVSFDHKSYGFAVNKTGLNYTLNITNSISFNNLMNYNLPDTHFDTWANNWSWGSKSGDLTGIENFLKTPSNLEVSLNLLYQIRDRIIDSLFQNKFPYSITFDIAIKGLKN